MRTLVDRPAFSFDQLRFDWGDVVLAALGWGEWQGLERELAEGLASAAAGTADDGEAVRRAVVAFRRGHGLLAASDYLGWLADRSLSADDVTDHVTRGILRERAGTVPSSGAGLIAETIRAEAILGGRLRGWADRLARCAAAARGLEGSAETPAGAVPALLAAASAHPSGGLTEAEADPRAPRIAALQSAERAFAEAVATPERIERCLAAHRLDWRRYRWEEAVFASEGAAREAALWVREEGLPLAEVATLAHATVEHRSAFADGIGALAGVFAATRPAELAGPLDGGGTWRLVRMLERTSPAIDDAAVRERASDELVGDAVERHLAGRVRWHDEL